MALVIADRVKETSTTTGTGTFTLGGAVTGYQAFSVIGNGNQCYYTIVGTAVASEWEVGVGTYSSSTITRDAVLDSSAGGAKVSFSAGNKEVFVTYPADRSVSQADIGTAPNEIPLNQYLGSMAYQDSDNVNIGGGVANFGNLSYTGTLTGGTGVINIGSGQVYKNASGNVGIGTSAPSNTLHVNTAATTAVNFQRDAGANGSLTIGFPSQKTTLTSLTDFIFVANNLERLRIDSAGNVGIGTSSPSASAILDVQSTTKGVRMPNMTTTQKNAIASPAAGLMVFDTTLSKLSVYTGSAWETITSL
jgi:hypothetical protein